MISLTLLLPIHTQVITQNNIDIPSYCQDQRLSQQVSKTLFHATQIFELSTYYVFVISKN